MKLYHYSILFIVIAIGLLTVYEISENELIEYQQKHQKYNDCLERAVDDATEFLFDLSNNAEGSIAKEQAVSVFFEVLYASLGIMDDEYSQQKVKERIPLILAADINGCYIWQYDPFGNNNGNSYSSYGWSEKILYQYEGQGIKCNFTIGNEIMISADNGVLDGEEQVIDFHELADSSQFEKFRLTYPDSFLLQEETFEQKRQECIAVTLESVLKNALKKYQESGKGQDLNYEISLPLSDHSIWMRAIDQAGLFVIFQDEAYLGIHKDIYASLIVCGALVKKQSMYYLQKMENYLIYHKLTCVSFRPEDMIGSCYGLEACAEEGAFACRICSPDSGVYIPESDLG